jgi:hypothetical protein
LQPRQKKGQFVKSIKFFVVLLFFVISTITTTKAHAQGGYAGAFLRMGIAARSEAMGRAYVAMVEGNESAFFNAASVAMFERREINTSFRPLTLDRTFAYIGIGLPIHPKADTSGRTLDGGLSFSWIHAGVDNIDARDFDGEKTGTLSNSENAFNLSFALRPHPRVAIGLTGRVVMNRFPSVTQDNGTLSTSSFGFDFGALIEPLDGVRIGGTARNVNLKYTWNSQEVYERGTSKVNEFPRSVRVGVAISRLVPWLTLAADYEKREFRDATVHFGALASLKNMVQLRVGINEDQPTFGGGYVFDLFGRKSELHYAFVSHPENLDSDHVFGWAFVF